MPNAPSEMSKESKIIAACCAATIVICLLPWYSITTPMGSASKNAFDINFWPILTFLGALAAGVIVVGTGIGKLVLKEESARLIAFGACAAAVLGEVVFYFQSSPDKDMDKLKALGLDAGRTIWPWLALAAMSAATAYSYQRWQDVKTGAAPGGDATPQSED